MKYRRHSKILSIIGSKDIQTQESLLEELKESGFNVTQATVSRDIKELGLIKIPTGGNIYRYAQPIAAGKETDKHITIFSEAVISVNYALHTIVVKCFPGMAPAVAASLDNMIAAEILGSVAGDDTILIITEGTEKAEKISAKLNKIFRLTN